MKKIYTIIAALGLTLGVNAQSPLVNKSQLVNFPGAGSGGANASATETGLGFTLYGAGMQNGTTNNWIAEKFTVPASGWTIDSLICYGYQTGSTLVSTFTGLFSYISADSSGFPKSTPVLGNKSTSSLIGSTFSNIYRTPDTTASGLLNTQRPIMKLKSNISGNLTAGSYWVVWNATGSLASGPWCPPVTIKGVTNTGNAMQYLGASSSWTTMTSGGFAQGAPYMLYGKITTSVKETVASSNQINIVPSPMVTLANVNINLAENSGVNLSDLSFVIMDVTGKEIMNNSNITSNSFVIERGDMAAGTYIYKVINKNDGAVLKSDKLVIQ